MERYCDTSETSVPLEVESVPSGRPILLTICRSRTAGPGSLKFEGRNGRRQIVAILTSDPFLTQADAYMVNISALLILKCVLST